MRLADATTMQLLVVLLQALVLVLIVLLILIGSMVVVILLLTETGRAGLSRHYSQLPGHQLPDRRRTAGARARSGRRRR